MKKFLAKHKGMLSLVCTTGAATLLGYLAYEISPRVAVSMLFGLAWLGYLMFKGQSKVNDLWVQHVNTTTGNMGTLADTQADLARAIKLVASETFANKRKTHDGPGSVM
jgi:hypothetical protein